VAVIGIGGVIAGLLASVDRHDIVACVRRPIQRFAAGGKRRVEPGRGPKDQKRESEMTEPSKLKLPAFEPNVVSESNFTSYPALHRAANQMRYNRRLGDHAGLRNFGVNLTRIIPGGQSSFRHAHSRQDEFVYVLEGEVVLETNDGEQLLTAGMCAGFPAGSGDAHRFINRTGNDVRLLVIGDRTSGDEITYPDVDMRAVLEPGGGYKFTTKAGEPL